MKFSEQWLREWVDPKISIEDLTLQLTMLGLEVDRLEPVAQNFDKVVVGKVLSREEHPDAKRLSLCQVDVGEKSPLQIVCGATNVRAELKVAVVKVGGFLPGEVHIKTVELRGVASHGMICSGRELGLSDEHKGILELASDAPVGMDLREYMKLDDHVIDIDLTPNRGDCASIRGVALEIAANNQMAVTAPKFDAIPSVSNEKFPVTLQAKAACPRYVGRVIRHIKSQLRSPLWLEERLRRSGLRTIHPVVDVTNYVMLELGQPLHAFDLDKLNQGIEIRFANPGETITLLDGQCVELVSETLVIADQKASQAIAGVMGGSGSEVDDKTQHIFLESAFFSPKQIGRTVRHYGIHSDSSYRFERGVDYNLQREAIERATGLLLEICGGEPGPVIEVLDASSLPKMDAIKLRRVQIKRVLGKSIPDERIVSILESLQMTVTPTEDGWYVLPPSHRFDLSIEVDVIEEITRLYGYDNIASKVMQGELSIPKAITQNITQPIQKLLMGRGYHEAITYSFTNQNIEKLLNPTVQPIKITNPIASDLAVMRTSLWSSLLTVLQYNLNRQCSRVRLFETGLCFIPQDGKINQALHVAGVACGSVHESNWSYNKRSFDFFDIKADVEQLLSLVRLKKQCRFEVARHPALHPGQSAAIYCDDQCIGYVGALHPEIVTQLGLNEIPFLFNIDLNLINSGKPRQYEPVSKFPSISRDIAIIVDNLLPADKIVTKILKFSGHLLNTVRIFDIYLGEGVEFGKKSVALELTFQDPARTLVDEEVNEIIQRVINGLQSELNAKLRA